eukprot:4135469-Amphidinium_carterae.1
MQKVTSDIILQEFYVDANGVDSEKLKRAMQKEMDNLKELKVFTDVNIKSMSAEEVSRIINSRWVISIHHMEVQTSRQDLLPEDSVN